LIMTKIIILPFLCLFASLSAAPTREAFALEERAITGVPTDAFELGDSNLTIELWARSPMIYSPVAMDFDAQGRLWTTEGIDYQRGRRIAEGRSIIVLEDKDWDGKADTSTIFVTEKEIRHAALGIAVFDNQIVLSSTPSIIVYTDVNRNAVFDEGVDKREVFLTGFRDASHDHTLHAVVGAPSGQWHFSYGNRGADITTKDGRNHISGCYYGYSDGIGKKSSDGEVYVGGMTMRINPDGTGLTPTGENMRNSHDMFVSSYGDIYQSDNDDPAHARISWVMEHANMGYADLTDGSRSWEEVAKSWEEPAGWSKSLRFSRSHWRENYPGAFPPGTIYGAGSPTGNVLIEDHTLGLAGTYLVACMVRKEVMTVTPKWKDAQIEMGDHQPFIRLKNDRKGEFFLPTDLALAPDGSLFLSDFYNDTSRGTNQVSGSIYRITRKDQKPLVLPKVNFSSISGLLQALKNPAVNVRSHAAHLLVKKGKEVFDHVHEFLRETTGEPVLQARALWVLAQIGNHEVVKDFLDNEENEKLQVVAYRALRHANPTGTLARAKEYADSKNLFLRREIAVSLRGIAFEDCSSILESLVDGYDGRNRYYLEALGAAFHGREKRVYNEIVTKRSSDPSGWDWKAKNLAWRLHTPEAIRDLDQCIRAQKPPVDEFRFLAMAFASFRTDEERKDRVDRLRALAQLPEFSADYYQVTVDEIIEKDLNDLEGEMMETSYLIPQQLGQITEVSKPGEIAQLKGDITRGRAVAAKCYLCHKLDGLGVGFGPNLTHWGKERTVEEIVKEIVYPDEKLAHGYDKPVRLVSKKTGEIAEGLLSNYSWHAGSLKLKVLGGQTRKILFRRAGAKINYLNESWMPSASEMGMSDQDLADLAVYMQSTGSGEDDSTSGDSAEPVPPTGNEPGWKAVTGEDFVNVNCFPDTWRWEGGHAYCTGKPTGVIRYREPLENFELLLEWMHKKNAGNSGVFVWATPQSISKLAAGHGRLPHGIEVQVLDLGYAEHYTKRHKKPADWFTSHGDVFPVGPVKMNPFPPIAPNGRRSFPTKETTKGINQWNHYYVRAVDGEVRLWVNGEEVSGGDGIEPASGYFCLESEGAPIEFRNIRLRKLSEVGEMKLPVHESALALTLKGHPALGIWKYLNGYTREIAEDGQVTLRLGEDVIWKRRCISKSENEFVLEGNLVHKLIGDILHIEGKYKAVKE
jgi:putative membrane-bound dehydrogenase-like protein